MLCILLNNRMIAHVKIESNQIGIIKMEKNIGRGHSLDSCYFTLLSTDRQ